MMAETKTCSECGGTMRYVINGKTNLYERCECNNCENVTGYTE